MRARSSSGRRNACVGRQDRPLDVAVQLLVALLDRAATTLSSASSAPSTTTNSVSGAQVVEQRRRRLEEQRQVVLDAGRQLRVGDRAVDGAAARLDGKMLAKALAKELDRRLVERKLARGQDLDLVGLARRELRLRVERAQRFDLVVEQVDAHGRRAAGREHVEHGAAHRELAGLGDLLDAQIAVRRSSVSSSRVGSNRSPFARYSERETMNSGGGSRSSRAPASRISVSGSPRASRLSASSRSASRSCGGEIGS